MERPDIDELIERADRRAVYINQVKHAKEAFRAQNVLFWERHPFELTQEFMGYVALNYINWLTEKSTFSQPAGIPPETNSDPIIFLDKNDEPVMIEDMTLFVETMEEVHTEALNQYYNTYSKLQLARSTEELIEVG